MLMQLSDRSGCRRFGRIEESQITDQHHIHFILHREIQLLLYPTLLGNCQHTHAVTVHPPAYCQSNLLQFVRHRAYFTVIFHIRTDLHHLLDRSFRDDLPFTVVIFHDHRHAATGKVERNLVHFPVFITQMFEIQFLRMRKDRLIHQVLQPGLEITVEISMSQHTQIVVPMYIEIFLQHDLIARQRPRLICTKNIHRPETLYRIQILHDRLAA